MTKGVGLAVAAMLGAVAIWLLLVRHQGPLGCGVKAELRRVSFPPVFNPNQVQLDYIVANHSGQNYELPTPFRVLRKSPDGVLHSDANDLGFPQERFFPQGHSVEFSVWVAVGNVLKHAPTDKETAELEKQLAGTQAYVLFDEKRGCEIELPVRR
jgi:hypothetical protein